MNRLYLNNAATSFPKFEGTADFIKELIINKPLNSNRSVFKDNIIESTRKLIADTFNIKKEERIIFTSGATEGFNLLLQPKSLEKRHIISTVIEHNCVLRCLNALKEVNITIVGCDNKGFVDISAIESNINDNTEFVIINHASNVTGAIQNIEKLHYICRERNIQMIVDASQSAGVLPIDIDKFENASFVFTGHKGLMGLPGTGFIYINKKLFPEPLKMGGNGIWSDLEEMPSKLPYRYEAGTQNFIGIASLWYSLSMIKRTGISTILNRKKEITSKIIKIIQNNKELRLFSPEDENKNIGIISFSHPDISSDEFSEMLYDGFNIETRSGLHCAPMIHKSLGTFDEGLVRISPSFFTTDEEIDIFATAIAKIIISL